MSGTSAGTAGASRTVTLAGVTFTAGVPATARITGAEPVGDPEPASEGTAETAPTATGAFGLAATVRFQVPCAVRKLLI